MHVHQFLEASAARTPDALVLIERDRQVQYGTLDRMANQCAHLFRTCGVTRGDRVVVALDQDERVRRPRRRRLEELVHEHGQDVRTSCETRSITVRMDAGATARGRCAMNR